MLPPGRILKGNDARSLAEGRTCRIDRGLIGRRDMNKEQ